MKTIKNKSIKWWIVVSLYIVLFVIIGTFAYIKTSFLLKGVQIDAKINYSDASPVAKVVGHAKNANYLSLNGREIFIDKDGSFSETIVLLPGPDVIHLEAEDKFGNIAEKDFELIYNEPTEAVAFNQNKIIN